MGMGLLSGKGMGSGPLPAMPLGAGTGMALGAPGGVMPIQPRPQDYGMNMLPPTMLPPDWRNHVQTDPRGSSAVSVGGVPLGLPGAYWTTDPGSRPGWGKPKMPGSFHGFAGTRMPGILPGAGGNQLDPMAAAYRALLGR